MMDSDGNLNPLFDLFIESGIDGFWPIEENTGMCVPDIREKYGEKIWLGGNIDKKKAAFGGAVMRKEVDLKIQYAKELGGYAPGLDHLVHGSFTFEKFKEYSNYMKKKLGYESKSHLELSFFPRVL